MKKKKVVTFGEVMMRFSPPGYAKFSQATTVELAYGGGEANVAISLAYFGLEAFHITCFPDNLVGRSATQYLRHHWLHTKYITYGEGRMGKYFLEKGAVHRPSEVVYERDNSAFSKIKPDTFDWKRILRNADWFHWTGITPGISENAAESLRQAIQVANELGVPVSVDVHSRKNLWQYGKDKTEVMPELVQGCDVVIASPYDMQENLGVASENDDLQTASEKLKEKFPRVQKVVDKKRETLSASHNRIQGFIWNGKEVLTSPSFDVTHIVDRVGTGDAYAAGMIYGLLNLQDEQKAVDFAAAACSLKHTVEGDANVISAEAVDSLVQGNTSGRIKR
ncbi:PfkB family carbohydrate kinase [Ekhidna sp.]|uniref:PfkB family carbohydrate kinase n=1 Tax=Ekhidna sp. TaxID=2608089 RepID=UPI003BACB657